MSAKNFLLYFGNARAGSTWLHGELSRRSDCNFPLQKEIFIFQDFNPVPGPEGFDKTKYFENMAALVNDEKILLTGDLTPSNANATKEQLYWFKQNAESVGLNVLPVMTLRDPITQVISYTIMSMSTRKFLETNSMDKIKLWYINNLVSGDLVNTISSLGVSPDSVTDILKFGIPGFGERLLSWRETVENVTQVFGKIHFNFYETLFTNESASNLFSYLGLPYTDVVESHKETFNLQLSENEKVELFGLYPFEQEKYDYAVSRFGKELIDSIWATSGQINFSRKIFSFGKHPEFSDDDKLLLYDNYPFMRENYDFAVKRFGKNLIESVWWNPYK